MEIRGVGFVALRKGRWTVSFVIVALLAGVISVIVFRGITESDWLYGTYGGISQSQWDQIAKLRDLLVQLDVAPDAVNALDNALLIPRPSTENVLYDLRRAVLALDGLEDAKAHELQLALNALIGAIQPGHEFRITPWPTPTAVPTPTYTPIMGAPIAQLDHGCQNPLSRPSGGGA